VLAPERRRDLRRALAALVLILLLAWSAGFVLFAWRATRPPGPPPQADGIVVLTGGAGRIEAALSLLAGNRARLMLISGVMHNLDLQGLMHASGLRLPAGTGLERRIALGHVATTTFGNAIETAAWAHANGLHSLIVVTAGYHMQRALAEIGAALPDTILLPYPVLPPALRRPGSFGTLRLLVSEYDKWLLVASGLTGAGHLREIA
jgi:uncharacterized SAM-binding protein YcdF (DUF218 family)